jgi:SPP1 gp7 family putative phage head morphogenesis protein
MATCKYCKKSSWFLSLDNAGICKSCSQTLAPIINRAVHIIEESDNIIEKSKNLETKLSRLDVIEKVVKEHFLPYEKMGIQVANQTEYQVLDKVAIMREEIIVNTLQEYLNKAKDKAEKAKSAKSKINAYSKVLQKITELKYSVSNPDIISSLENKVKLQLNQINPTETYKSDLEESVAAKPVKMKKVRKDKIYNTEAKAALHKATMQEFKEASKEGIKLFAEWSTAGFNVCPLCEPLEGKVFELKEIEWMIPRHPDCRCVAIPANVGEERKEPIKTITRKQAEKLGEDNLKRVRREERLEEQEGEST